MASVTVDSSHLTEDVISSPALTGRLAFIDYARAAATLMMVLGHTIDALLSPSYRETALFHGWTYVRGLTASTFLLVSGFAFGLVALRHAPILSRRTPARRRCRRGLLLVVCGYALHFPASNVWQLPSVSTDAWRSFLAVDVLQTIGITIICLQAIALVFPQPRQFSMATVAVAMLVCLWTPEVWAVRWSESGLTAIAPYMSADTGSLFPLFPWLAYGTLGAALGAWFLLSPGPTPVARAVRTLLPTGVAAIGAALLCRFYSWEPIGGPNLGAARVSQFLLQAGLVCLVVTSLATVVNAVRPQPLIVQSLARHSLLVYAAHLCIIYGSPWNAGLRQLFGAMLSPMLVAGFIIALWTTMVLLSISWRLCTVRYPHIAIRLRASSVAILLLALLV